MSKDIKDLAEIIEFLEKGKIGVMATDTIYGLVGLALSKKVVARIYKVKKRSRKKPMIILISGFKDLKLFDIKLSQDVLAFWKKILANKITLILPCQSKKFSYLHRNKNKLAFRIPNVLRLKKLLAKTGPLVAPSANLEGFEPAKTIKQAKKYFGSKCDFYFDPVRNIRASNGVDSKEIKQKPSLILEIKRI